MTAETDDRAPIIYLRDVAFSELECLLQFIYSGKTSVPGAELASFLGLARGLGVRGFTEGELSSPPGKRKIEEGLLKHTVSEPVYPSGKPGKLFSAVVIFHGNDIRYCYSCLFSVFTNVVNCNGSLLVREDWKIVKILHTSP